MAAARQTSQRLTLLMLVLASVTVLTLDYHGEASRAIGHVRNGFSVALSPIQRGLQAALHPVGDFFSAGFHYGALQTEVEQLKAELSQSDVQIGSNNFAQQYLRDLEDFKTLPYAGNIPVRPAEVIEGPSSNFQSSVEINEGTSSGVGVGMPVVAEGGLVGRVTSASATTAIVQKVDDQCSSGCDLLVQDQAGVGFTIVGEGVNKDLSIESFSPTTKVTLKKGDKLYTTGQTNDAPEVDYPPGVPVAVVEQAQTGIGGTVSGVVDPIANLDNLVFVGVMLWTPTA